MVGVGVAEDLPLLSGELTGETTGRSAHFGLFQVPTVATTSVAGLSHSRRHVRSPIATPIRAWHVTIVTTRRPILRWTLPSPAGWVLLLAAAAALRLWNLHTLPPGLWLDEARNLVEISTFLETGRWAQGWLLGQPVFALPAATTLTLFGKTPFGLRMAAAAIGILTVPALYLFVREIASRRIAWLSAWLLAASYWHVIFSRAGFRTILVPLFLCLLGWSLARALREQRRRDWVRAGLVLGIGCYTYYAFWPVAACALLYLGALTLGRDHRRAGLALLVFVPFLIAWWVGPGAGDPLGPRIAETSALGESLGAGGPAVNTLRTLGMFLVAGDTQPRHNIPGWPAWPLLLLPFLVLGMARAPGRGRWGGILVALWVVTLVPTIASDACPHHLRALGNVIPTCILTALGLVSVAAWLECRRRAAGVRMLGAVILLSVLFGAWAFFGAYAHQPALRFAWQAKAVEIADFIQREAPGRSAVFINYGYGRQTTEALLRHEPAVHFEVWLEQTPVPDTVSSAPANTVWIVLPTDLRRLGALRGEPRLLRAFDADDGTPPWLGVDFPPAIP